MSTTHSHRGYTLTHIADTHTQLASFAPYVPAINSHGHVAFQARAKDGHTSVLVYRDGEQHVAIAHKAQQIYSHPTLSDDGLVHCYATLPTGKQALLSSTGETPTTLTPALTTIGPMGPTANIHDEIAFRATNQADIEGHYLHTQNGIKCVADTSDIFASFGGLPVVNDTHHVLFQAEKKDGTKGLYLWKDGTITSLAESGGRFSWFGLFPMISKDGYIVTSAQTTSGAYNLYRFDTSEPIPLLPRDHPFESVRGGLIAEEDQIVYFATPKGGTLGMYVERSSQPSPIIAFGDELYGSTITGFALNPVSINQYGQCAFRVQLANQHEYIFRTEGLFEQE
ncbi:MAG: hypothetical protein CL920_18295 [Deltaproteobacteria bacterium]|nr:hypothetical protein [Deltaproteobacteria bacterium]|tara:strand:- start:472 stop:1488 length:1017 start_codon:yes stop_codon:yes gene_type:complete